MSAVTAVAVAGLLAASAALAVPPGRRPTPDRPRRTGTGPSASVPVLVVVATLLAVATVWLLAGATVATVVTSSLVMAATVAGLVRRHRGARQLAQRRRSVSRASATLGAQLRAGLSPAEALRHAAADWPVMAPAAAALALGDEPADVWDRQGQDPGLRGLREIGRGWRLCALTGAPLAPTLERLADALESDEALGITVSSELAAPRATGRVMAVLPLVGLAIGYGMGGDPLAFLLQTAPGRGCLLAGCLLAAAGV